MLTLTPALGLLCLFFGPVSSLAASASHLTKRSFSLKQKWQRDEVNCVSIYNPSRDAKYHPGYMIHMSYGTEQCNGATAAGPWKIHLYNNPEIVQGKIQFDYHEVIADGLKEYNTQYVWNISPSQQNMAKVKKVNEYYVRVETSTKDGTKLVGNAGPFSISPDLSRRADAVDTLATTDPVLNAEFALKPHSTPLDFPDESVQDTIAKPDVPVAAAPELPTVATPVDPVVAAPAAPIAPSTVDASLPADEASNLVNVQVDTPLTASVAPASPPTSESLGLTDDTAPKPPITEIPTTSFIPNKLLVGAGVAGGALGLGLVGASFFGTVGTVIGTVLGGVIGGVAVLLSYLVPSTYY
ncbi:hypothetical protein BGX27_009975 [Mortierella sp. AM989]|nr:hypothetical protein BGX27_009975 [Mortierella sp. AM989]